MCQNNVRQQRRKLKLAALDSKSKLTALIEVLVRMWKMETKPILGECSTKKKVLLASFPSDFCG